MSDFLITTVTILTLVIIVVFSLIFLKRTKTKNTEMEIDLSAFEDRVLELISKFQHISATKLTAMENKIEEMNKLLREANEMYFRLSSILSDTTKTLSEIETKTGELQLKTNQTKPVEPEKSDNKSIKIESEANEKDKIIEEKSNERKEEDHFTFEEEFINPPDLKNSSLEHKIMNMSSEGMEAEEIAKKLGIGKGEVDLVLGLFKRKYS
ncbi:MAG: hypothetical protein PWQ84_586 [Thermotogaceae bacterium]|jgi:hypothetical protein|nr:hypothetical protein [Thermotogaceae bacterium]